MGQRAKIRLIDKKFQMKTTITVMGIILIALLSMIAITGIIISDNNVRIQISIQKINQVRLAEQGGTTQNGSGELRETMNSTIPLLESLILRNRIIVKAMIIITIALSILLYYYLINLTHHIAGPIHVLMRNMKEIMDGEKPDIRALRKNDEFKEFYDQFMAMISSFNKDE